MNPETPLPVEALTDYERLLRLEELLETVLARLTQIESQQQQLRARMDEIHDSLLTEIASDRKRITALEARFDHIEPESDTFQRRKENVMAILLANGGKMLQKELAARLELDKAEISRLIHSLERDGVIKTKRSSSNKKYKVICISHS